MKNFSHPTTVHALFSCSICYGVHAVLTNIISKSFFICTVSQPRFSGNSTTTVTVRSNKVNPAQCLEDQAE